MNVRRYRGQWSRRTLRISVAQRAAVVEIATDLRVTTDGVCRLALRAYATRRGFTLADFAPVTPAKALGFIPVDDNEKPRIWLRFRDSWEPVITAMYAGECNTFPGVIRSAISEFHAAGAEVWRAAMAGTPATSETKGTSK